MSAADIATQMSELRQQKPRPIEKLYGKQGPTPEQLAAHQQSMRSWNRQYNALAKRHRQQLETDNLAFRLTTKAENANK